MVLSRFDPGDYLKILHQYPIDAMGGAPPIYTALVNHPDFPRYASDFKKGKNRRQRRRASARRILGPDEGGRRRGVH